MKVRTLSPKGPYVILPEKMGPLLILKPPGTDRNNEPHAIIKRLEMVSERVVMQAGK